MPHLLPLYHSVYRGPKLLLFDWLRAWAGTCTQVGPVRERATQPARDRPALPRAGPVPTQPRRRSHHHRLLQLPLRAPRPAHPRRGYAPHRHSTEFYILPDITLQETDIKFCRMSTQPCCTAHSDSRCFHCGIGGSLQNLQDSFSGRVLKSLLKESALCQPHWHSFSATIAGAQCRRSPCFQKTLPEIPQQTPC
jgi:hypothetical protein